MDTIPRYTIIDLGSNSFHMLTVSKQDSGFNVISKHKQKVRLAAGLDPSNNLDTLTMQQGWSCLRDFKAHLDKIKPTSVLITATAALRLATNKDVFLEKAQQILALPINLISGLKEAETIFKGVSFTEQIDDQKILVIDIGGASTELILGERKNISIANSLDMGCVTWMNNYFNDGQLSESNFSLAIEAAKKVIAKVKTQYTQEHWELTLGASGTIQALTEVNLQQNNHATLSITFLNEIKQQCIDSKHMDQLALTGLKPSRTAFFPSGLAILIALFEEFDIISMKLSKGALREGLISMLLNGEDTF